MTESILGDNQEPSDYLASMIGKDGKFYREDRETALQELAKGKFEADRYIAIKNKQFDDLREDYLKAIEDSKSRAKLEELIDQLDKKQNLNGDTNTPITDTRPTLKLEDIKNLARATYAEEETARQHQSNLNAVKAKLKEQYGDNFASVVRERIQSLGMSEHDFNDLARKSPAAVLSALGSPEQKRESFQSPPQSKSNFRPASEPKRTWSYYQEMRKTNPKLYADSKIMNQMLQDAEALGTEFEDGDFHTRQK